MGPTTAPARSQTRSTLAISPADSIDSIKKKLKVTDAVASREFLNVRGWTHSVDLSELTIANIGIALKNIIRTAAGGKDIKEGATAVANVLEAMAADHLTHTVALSLATKLDKVIDQKMAIFTDQLQKAEQRIADTTEAARDELQRADELLNQAADNTQMPANTTTAPLGIPEVPGVGPRTYAAALQNQLPLGHQSTLARNAVCAKQILIDQQAGAEKTRQELGEEKVVKRANDAVEFITDEDWPTGTSFISA
jgi:hypothetical protein